MKIGDYPGMGLADARTERQEMEKLVKSGKNPKEQIKQDQNKNVSFDQFTNEYYEKVVKKDRKNPSGIRRYLDRDILPILKDKLLSESPLKMYLRS